jgi:hypothetical protein
MAKQTINIGTAPNDGTGTPLRTAFDYCNLNFTELYTAVGPSGNNIVVPGTATITGNLTVDTNTLFVDAANNRVGIGTATPAVGNLLHISGTAAVPLLMQRTGSNDVYLSFTDNSGLFGYFGFSNGELRLQTPGSSYANKYVISSDGTSTWQNVGGVAGTAMTLNSTGLGVGVTPSAGRGAIQLSAGIGFPATQVASSDANTLDDYVESTFSPTIIGSTTAGSATYSTQIGRATKVGRLVTFQLRVAYSAGTGTGNLRVGGLPFTAGVGSVFTIYAENIALTASNYAVASLSSGNTSISVDQLPVGGGAATAVAYDAAGDIQISGSYIV